MINLPKNRENYLDAEQAPRDKVMHHKYLGGFYHGTAYALKNHANLTITRKDFLKSFPEKSSPQRSAHLKILPETENSPFQSLSHSCFPLSPVESQRGWK
jgi:hypothetical protein